MEEHKCGELVPETQPSGNGRHRGFKDTLDSFVVNLWDIGEVEDISNFSGPPSVSVD